MRIKVTILCEAFIFNQVLREVFGSFFLLSEAPFWFWFSPFFQTSDDDPFLNLRVYFFDPRFRGFDALQNT